MKDRTNQRGQQLAYFGIFALVLFALAALAIDAARLFFVAREAQTVADAAALAGAVALARPGGDDALAVLAAQGVALQNSVDNTLATVIAADIVVGRWSGSAFTTDTPHNAVKTTPGFTINNIFALWSPTSNTRREAIAAFETIGQGAPGLPIVLGSCFTCDPGSCSNAPINLAFSTSNGTTTNGDNAAWAVYDANNGTSHVGNYVPTACGGGGSTNPTESAGSNINMTNGVAVSLCSGFQSSNCIGQLYLVPVVQTPCGGVLNQSSPIIGFATIRITAANCNPPGFCANVAGCTGPTIGCACNNDNDCPSHVSGSCVQKYITVQPTFIDCNLPQNATVCQGGGFSDSCPDCGTGKVRLVE